MWLSRYDYSVYLNNKYTLLPERDELSRSIQRGSVVNRVFFGLLFGILIQYIVFESGFQVITFRSNCFELSLETLYLSL